MQRRRRSSRKLEYYLELQPDTSGSLAIPRTVLQVNERLQIQLRWPQDVDKMALGRQHGSIVDTLAETNVDRAPALSIRTIPKWAYWIPRAQIKFPYNRAQTRRIPRWLRRRHTGEVDQTQASISAVRCVVTVDLVASRLHRRLRWSVSRLRPAFGIQPLYYCITINMYQKDVDDHTSNVHFWHTSLLYRIVKKQLDSKLRPGARRARVAAVLPA